MRMNLLKSLKININYIIIFILVCILFMFLNIFFIDEIQIIDNNIALYVKNNFINNNALNSVKFLTNFGDKFIFGIIIILLLLLKNKKYGIYMFINLIYVAVINFVLKFSFQRNRPIDKVIDENGFSFPSGHAMCSTAFYGLLMYYILKSTKDRFSKIIFVIMFSLIILVVGVTRIYLNVHYFSDVIAGIILGILLLVIFIKVTNNMEELK